LSKRIHAASGRASKALLHENGTLLRNFFLEQGQKKTYRWQSGISHKYALHLAYIHDETVKCIKKTGFGDPSQLRLIDFFENEDTMSLETMMRSWRKQVMK
jgi:hypothetical protein